MAYQVTFTLNSAYTGTTQADDFTIVAKHSNGSPADDTLATGVTKANLIAGVTYTVADTVTGGTVTSTGVCTNSVTWLGLNATPPPPTATPTSEPTATPAGPTLYSYYITQFLIDSSDFCITNYVTSTLVKSESATITGMINTIIYDSNGDPFVPSPADGWAFIFGFSNEGSVTGEFSPKYAIQVSALSQVDSVSIICAGGGGEL